VIAQRRDTLVRMVAAHHEAINYLYDKANWPAIARMAAPTGRSVQDSIKALEIFTEMDYWPKKTAGLSEKRINRAVSIQADVGKRTKGKSGINPKKSPATHAQLTDLTIFDDAMALMKKMK
jgi:hypothetical protein